MKRLLFGIVWVAGAVLLGSGLISAAEKPVLPEATGQAVADYIRASHIQNWALVPGTIAMREGRMPHGALQNVRANDIAMKGFAAKSGPMPDGTMIVKENFNADSVLQGFTVMYKKTGYNPAAGDYLWVSLGPDLQVKAEGKIAACIDCHSSAAGVKDFIILSPRK